MGYFPDTFSAAFLGDRGHLFAQPMRAPRPTADILVVQSTLLRGNPPIVERATCGQLNVTLGVTEKTHPELYYLNKAYEPPSLGAEFWRKIHHK